MTIPEPGQTHHLMNFCDVMRVRADMHRKEGRNFLELKLYTTDDLRQLYQSKNDDLIRLRDGLVSRHQLVAEIRWRLFVDKCSYISLFVLSLIAAVAGVVAAVEGLKISP